ncbi:MAG: hypothetical protein BRC32_07780 [Actinobacteria bacterium QS_8_72_14]|nr:MAG: hypothetical protein BRC32_07780 [Actinobacteria bacterium QS_8_72_14]
MSELLEATSPKALTPAVLRSLAGITGTAVVSVAIPTQRATAEPQQNALGLKSATQRIEQQLAQRGLEPHAAGRYTGVLERLQADEVFWGHQLHGLCVIVWDDGWRAVRLPYPVEARAVVDTRPHLQPLLPGVAEQGMFYVLALSQRHVRLLRASSVDVAPVDLSGLGIPARIEDALPDEDLQSPQLHARSGGAGGRMAIFHGHGDSGEFERQILDKYLRELARGIDDLLADDGRPLVLAGVEEVCAQFREHTGLRTVLADEVSGNPDDALDAELRDAAWPLVEPVLRRPLEDTVERFEAHHGTGLALADLPEVLMSAAMGRVASLLVRSGAERWGRFEQTEGLMADRAQRQDPGDENLVEQAIALVLDRGGHAYVLEADAMPADADLAAVCRY